MANIKKNTKDSFDLKKYAQFLEHIKKDIYQSQLRAALSVTKELLLLYWRIGKGLTEKIEIEKWGSKVVEKLAHDLGNEFPGMSGFSRTNLYRMVAFYTAYSNCPTAMGQIENNPILRIPWGHNITLLEKLEDNKQRFWYAYNTIKNGWSRSVLSMWIESDLFSRQGKAITNFDDILPSEDSDVAQQTLKDPYDFEFIVVDKEAREKEIEDGLIQHIQKFLIELGKGFAFVGRQYQLTLGQKDIYIDMLFYHLDLRCYIVIELKAAEFDGRDVGQIGTYLHAVDKLLRHPGDKPTIGLLLCQSKDNVYAEYALGASNKPIGISQYTTKLVESLPKELKSKLPTIAEIEAELEKKGKTSIVEEIIKIKKASRKK